MRDQRDDGVWDEKTGLLLCLKKYIPDLEQLKSSITAIDPNSLNHYQTSDVSFASDGKKINFNDSSDAIYATIRNSVYSIRNSVVHSKESERLKYEPFRHDKELTKEIPLIRAIAEEIIINSAKPIELKL